MANVTLDETPVRTSISDSAIIAVAEGDKMKHITKGNLFAPLVGDINGLKNSRDTMESEIEVIQESIESLTEDLSGAVMQSELINEIMDPMPTYTDVNRIDTVGAIGNVGYIGFDGIPVAEASYRYSLLTALPESVTHIKISYSSFLGVSWYDENEDFIETVGSGMIDAYDVEFPVPDGAKYFILMFPTSYLPGGANYGAHPTYLHYKGVLPSVVPWIMPLVENINGAKPVLRNRNYAEYFPNPGYIDASGNPQPLSGYFYTDPIIIPEGKTELKVSNVGIVTIAFYDENNDWISTVGTSPDAAIKIFNIPAGAVSVRYISNKIYFPGGSSYESSPAFLIFPPYESDYAVSSLNPIDSQWKGKTIWICGTSVPAGYPKQDEPGIWAYPNKVALSLRANIVNVCVPNGIVRYTRANGSAVSGGRTALRFSSLSSDINYQNSMVDLIGTPNEPDVFIFNYDVNDIDEDDTDILAFDPEDPYNVTMSINSHDTGTYIGSYNFVIDALKAAKPKARIAFITHFSEDSYDDEGKYKPLIDIVKALGKYWGAPVLDMAAVSGMVNKEGNNTVLLYNPDSIHPASAGSPESVDILAKHFKEFLLRII